MTTTSTLAQYRMYVGGEWVESGSGDYFESDNPYLGEPWALIPRGTAADADRAVRAAHAAFTSGEWPRPVQMRIYQLKDDVKLQAATFEQVWKEDAAVLGQDILKRDEVFVYPNTRTDVKFDRDPTASHIVGAALFRNPKGKSWYMAFELPPPPGKGDCRTPGPDCPDGKCGGFNPNPKFSLWVDQTRVDDGADHLADVTDNKRIRVVQLSKPVPAAPAASGEKK